MKKRFKKLLALIGSVVVLGNTMINPFSAFARQILGQTDFDKGIGLPWHIVKSGTASMDFEMVDGRFKIIINNPGGISNGGEDRWDCQFRHKGLKLIKEHTYEVSYEISASRAGQYFTKIGNYDSTTVGSANAGEIWHSNGLDLYTNREQSYSNGWDLIKIEAGETKKVKMRFKPLESLDVAEWAFHLGGDGQYTFGGCFPAGTVIYFDNMSLIDLDAKDGDYEEAEVFVNNDISLNQLGYFPELQKKATYAMFEGEERTPLDDKEEKPFTIEKDGEVVYTGKTQYKGFDADSGNYIQVLDFSDFKTEGKDYVIKCGDKTSVKFDIGYDIYKGLYDDALNYFYLNRSGQEILSEYVVATRYTQERSKLTREAGHESDIAYVQSQWLDRYAVDGSDVERTLSQDVTGGWYDAGDYGKYVVNGGISAWTLQNIYERALSNGTADKYKDGTVLIPENNNKVPDILDESRYQMEFMIKMIVKDGPLKNMVYHKIHDFKWTALGLSPAASTVVKDLYRIIKPPSTAATLNLAATSAQAARLWKEYDEEFAQKCKEVAINTYEAAVKNPAVYAPAQSNTGGGPYNDTYLNDDFYWAACEMYLLTGEENYLEDMKKSTHYLEMPSDLGIDSTGQRTSFTWGSTQGLGTASLLVNAEKLPQEIKETVIKNVCDAADAYVSMTENQGYGIPLMQSPMFENGGTGYDWGSNSAVVNNALVIAMAYDITKDNKYLNAVSSSLDYIFGRNPMENSYVTGYGENHTKYPHHRYWAFQLDSNYPIAPSGVLSGGPNSAMQDPYIQGMGYKIGEVPPQKCYLDNIESYSTNECTINWNAPLTWIAAFMNEYVSENEEETVYELGDIDLSGNIDNIDLVDLCQVLIKEKTLNQSQKSYADLNNDNQVDIADAIILKQKLLGDK